MLNLDDERGLVELMDVRGGFDDPLERIDQFGHDHITSGTGGRGKSAHSRHSYSARGELG